MTEVQVQARLGEPFRDSRGHDKDQAKAYTLGWHQGFQVGLFPEFKKGVVVSQEPRSR
jgi:hypothetical protein